MWPFQMDRIFAFSWGAGILPAIGEEHVPPLNKLTGSGPVTGAGIMRRSTGICKDLF